MINAICTNPTSLHWFLSDVHDGSMQYPEGDISYRIVAESYSCG